MPRYKAVGTTCTKWQEKNKRGKKKQAAKALGKQVFSAFRSQGRRQVGPANLIGLENLLKALLKQCFEHLHQMARKPHTGRRQWRTMESPRTPLKANGKTRFWHIAAQVETVI